MVTTLNKQSWVSGEVPEILKGIHGDEVNIAIFNRDITGLKDELADLIQKEIEFRSDGDLDTIFNAIADAQELDGYSLLKKDIENLLRLFNEVANSESYRMYLATVSNNMCTKFHTDINDLRMLCTYVGPATLWLAEDNVDRAAEDCCDDDDCMMIDKSQVKQAETGSALILKGAIYPKDGGQPVLHRSPAIMESGAKRLLLRVDTNEFGNF